MPRWPLPQAAARISSFEKNPASPGIPARPSPPIVVVIVVATIREDSPPIFRRSCSPPRPWMTLPAPRNRSALKKACVTRWKMPAAYAPTPTAANM